MRSFIKPIVILVCILSISNSLVSQNQAIIDSLLRVIKTTNIDTVKINSLSELSKTFFYINPLRIKIYAEQGIDLARKINYHRGIADCTNNLGLYYFSQQDYVKALELHLIALDIYESIGNKNGSALSYLNIGIIAYSQKDFDKAIDYFTKALNIFSELKNSQKMADCYNNIGAVYSETKKYLKSIECYTNSIKVYEEIGDNIGLAGCYNNIGVIYNYQDNQLLAIKFFQKAIEIYKLMNFNTGIAESLVNIAEMYYVLKNYEISIDFAHQSLDYSKKINSLQLQAYAYHSLSECYRNLNACNKSFEYSQIYHALNDSIFNIEKNKLITDIEAKYQNNKKQQEIENQANELEKKSLELKVQKTQKFLIFIGFILMIIITILSIYSYLIKKRANGLLSLKNLEIENQKEKINVQKEEIEKQRDTVIKVNKELNYTNLQMIDSINYAKLIQMAILPSFSEIQKSFPESYIFFQPKDIVSGDFYWFSKQDNKIFIAMVDCTGHGVPGAFMSMIGNTLLNQIVNEKEIYEPNEILLNLHKGVLFALSQRHDSVQEDGMEISLCVIDKIKNELKISSSRQSVFIVSENEVIEDRGSLISIGSKKQMIELGSFHSHCYNFSHDSLLILSSDGYIDQFGGPENKKFSSKRFIELLRNLKNLSADQQKEIVENSFNEWKGCLKQTDDVTVIGINIGSTI